MPADNFAGPWGGALSYYSHSALATTELGLRSRTGLGADSSDSELGTVVELGTVLTFPPSWKPACPHTGMHENC
jgi:hypothetical protein